MSNVQLENGYTRIANEILEEIAKIKLSPTQYRLLFIIWRFTYGFSRNEHTISLSFFSQASGCNSRQIQRELKRLEERKVIFQNIKSGSYRKITFNKNHDEWIGKMTNGEIDNVANGESVNGTNGEIDNQEIKKEITKEKDNHIVTEVPYLKYEELFGTPSSILSQNFVYWTEQSQFQEPEAIICETIKRAKLQNPNKPAAYINSILKKLHNLELYTLSAVQEYNAKFDSKIKNKRDKDIPNLREMFDKSKQEILIDEDLREILEMQDEFPF